MLSKNEIVFCYKSGNIFSPMSIEKRKKVVFTFSLYFSSLYFKLINCALSRYKVSNLICLARRVEKRVIVKRKKKMRRQLFQKKKQKIKNSESGIEVAQLLLLWLKKDDEE